MVLLNEHTLAWLDGPEPGADGTWPMPAELARQIRAHYESVPGQRFETLRHGSLLIVRADPSLVERTDTPSALRRQLPLLDRKILQMILQGCSGREIARALHLSQRGVWYHIAQIKQHMGISTRQELIRSTAQLEEEEDADADAKDG